MTAELARLNQLTKKQNELYHQCAKRANLTDSQFWVLYAVCEAEDALCQNTFCERWCYSKQTVNTAVATLEKKGLLELRYAKGSHKQKEIRLTPAGQTFCDKHIRTLMRAESGALMQLTEEECQKFFSLQERLLATLERQLISSITAEVSNL